MNYVSVPDSTEMPKYPENCYQGKKNVVDKFLFLNLLSLLGEQWLFFATAYLRCIKFVTLVQYNISTIIILRTPDV
jgi:hypothetical protein